MKTFTSGVIGMGLKICLDTKGIHFIKPGVIGSSDEFYTYDIGIPLSFAKSLVGLTTLMFNSETWFGKKIKGFSEVQAIEIVKLYNLGVNNQYVELLEHVGIDGQEYNESPEYEHAIQEQKARYLQERADKAAKAATEALHAQSDAAQAAAAAANAFNRHQAAAADAIQTAAASAMQNAMTPPPMASSNVYHVSVNGQQYGPYDMQTMQQMAQAGQINGQSMVWTPGMQGWAAAQSVQELAYIFGAPVGTMPPPPAM